MQFNQQIEAELGKYAEFPNARSYHRITVTFMLKLVYPTFIKSTYISVNKYFWIQQ